MSHEKGSTREAARPRAGEGTGKKVRERPTGLISDLEWALASIDPPGDDADASVDDEQPTLSRAVIEQALSSGEPAPDANWDVAMLIAENEQTVPDTPIPVPAHMTSTGGVPAIPGSTAENASSARPDPDVPRGTISREAASPQDASAGEGGALQECGDEKTPIAALKARLAAFAEERDWTRFHQPKDLAMAVSVEAAELLELFLWVNPDQGGGRPAPERSRLEAEIADVAICLLNLCTRTGVDLSAAVARKLEQNAEKYPVALAKGSALKYDEY